VTNQHPAGLPAAAAAAANKVTSNTGGIPHDISKNTEVKPADDDGFTMDGFTNNEAAVSTKSSYSKRKSTKDDMPVERLLKQYVRNQYFPMEKFALEEDVVFSTKTPMEFDPDNLGVVYQDLCNYMVKHKSTDIPLDQLFVFTPSYKKIFISILGQKRNEFTTTIKDAMFGKLRYSFLDLTSLSISYIFIVIITISAYRVVEPK